MEEGIVLAATVGRGGGGCYGEGVDVSIVCALSCGAVEVVVAKSRLITSVPVIGMI